MSASSFFGNVYTKQGIFEDEGWFESLHAHKSHYCHYTYFCVFLPNSSICRLKDTFFKICLTKRRTGFSSEIKIS